MPGSPPPGALKPYADQVFDYNATVIDKLSRTWAPSSPPNWPWWNSPGRRLPFPSASFTAPASIVGPHPLVWRFLQRIGRRRRRRYGALRHRLGDFGLHRHSGFRCGVTALRPTYGLVSPTAPWHFLDLDKLGPFARCAGSCGVILQAIAARIQGPRFRRQELLLHAPIRAPHEGSPRGLRSSDFTEMGQTRHPPAFDAADRGAQRLRRAIRRNQAADFPTAALSTILQR